MKMTLQLDDVTYSVSQGFLELGVPEDRLCKIHRSVLEHEGQEIARRYRAGNLIALWIIELNIVRFYNTHGELLRTTELD